MVFRQCAYTISPCFIARVNELGGVLRANLYEKTTNFADFCIIRFCANRKHYASTTKSTHIR